MKKNIAVYFLLMPVLVCCFAVVPLSSTWASNDDDDIESCLAGWGKHPFGKGTPEYRTISTSVGVLGVGGDVNDLKKTKTPELILVKPSVNVLSKSVLNLKNPNGWYCIKAKVTVLGKTEINVGCETHLAASEEGDVTVMGKNETQTGVTVLGKSVVNKIGCDD